METDVGMLEEVSCGRSLILNVLALSMHCGGGRQEGKRDERLTRAGIGFTIDRSQSHGSRAGHSGTCLSFEAIPQLYDRSRAPEGSTLSSCSPASDSEEAVNYKIRNFNSCIFLCI